MGILTRLKNKFTTTNEATTSTVTEPSDAEWLELMQDVTSEFLLGAPDEDVLKVFTLFLEDRVRLGTQFVQDGEGELISHQILVGMSGDYVFTSAPIPLQYPLTPAPLGEVLGENFKAS